MLYGAARAVRAAARRASGDRRDRHATAQACGRRSSGRSPAPLLDVLALPDHGWRRDEVLAVLASAPVRDADGRRVPAARWDRISRVAGVVAGDDWETRLAAYAAEERDAAEQERTSEAPREGLIARRQRDADDGRCAADVRLRTCGAASTRARAWAPWPELAAWAADTFLALVGDIEDEPWLPEDEARAAEKVQRDRVRAGRARRDRGHR